LTRLARIAATLARRDALFPLQQANVAPSVTALVGLLRREADGRPGERLAQALVELGPSFIKLGQALATRPDLIGDDVADDLTRLQDRLDPFPGAEARRTIEIELGQPVAALFRDFSDAPVAAASIAQVHFATASDGREVAVKVLRPGIEAAFAEDLALFRWLAAEAERRIGGLRRLKPVAVVETFADTVRIEMDLRMEAAAAAELSENFAGDPDFCVPAVDWLRTGKRVLTLERVNGIRIDDVEALKAAGHDPRAVLEKSAKAFFRQVFRDGFFHADMHPGNMFVTADGRLMPVDFGIMGRLDKATRHYLADMLSGFLTGNYKEVAAVHFRAGFVPAEQSVGAFTQACRSIGQPIMGRPLNEISLARLLAQLFQVTEAFAMETQPHLLLLQKTMLVAEGVGRRLDPSVNMWQLAQPLVEDWMRDNRGVEARIGEAVGGVADALDRLPTLAQEASRALTSLAGGVKLHRETVQLLAAEMRRPQDSGISTTLAFWIVVAIALIAVLT
jgi:ubiquinone biosynthesis protein